MSAKNGVTMRKDRVKSLMSDIRLLTKQDILIGIPAAGGGRKDKVSGKGKSRKTIPDNINNAAIGYLMEMGEPAMNLPARPFLVPGVEAIKDKISNRLKKAANAAIDGRPEEVEKHLRAAGLQAESSIRATITNGDFAPLSERTIEARRRRGKTSEKPLIDTGQMRRAVTHVIRTKGQK